ncbi:lipoyl(octanoyl) transferase LipB [Legionella adelaidensis]|uniref:lipoyl(octanoyl) transferase LipB n=1 Tax=Legionella adelaidensis TaxID=45056 RepID=UPI000731795D|nr:lipoyl(octanoyl) transferase LipB [Legionella adelaidensis]
MAIRDLGIVPYLDTWEKMKIFTSTRDLNSQDEVWVLEHPPVYTQGQAGKPEHILNTNNIPIIQSDRGGQVTYHGPGQLVSYVLMDIKRRNLGIRTLVCNLEKILITLLAYFGITAQTKCGAPGVYVEEKKIASIGLRVKNGYTYHGVALNIDMDLTPFQDINPCGYQQLKMTQMVDLLGTIDKDDVKQQFIETFLTYFNQ